MTDPNEQIQIVPETRYLNTDDYFLCASGIFPARIHDGKPTYITRKTTRHLTHYDTACQGDDFCCKWAVILAVAAAVFCALLLSNPVGWAILAGLVIGLAIGMTLCGIMMAMGRDWYNYEYTLIINKEQFAIAGDSYMKCAIGGIITWQPQITSPGMALWTGIRNLGFATLQGVMYGYAGYGVVSLGTASGITAFAGNLGKGWLMTYAGYGAAIRTGVAFENVLYNDATGVYDHLTLEEAAAKRQQDFINTTFAELHYYDTLLEKSKNGEQISLEEKVNAIAIPFSFVGMGIHASETPLKPSEQIPRGLRRSAESLFRTKMTPRHLRVKMLKDNPELLDAYNEALRQLAESNKNNIYKEYIQARNNNFQGKNQAEISKLCKDTWKYVRNKFKDVAAERGINIDGEIHHWNYPKYDNPYDVLNPYQLTEPVGRPTHEAIHDRTTSNPSEKWEGPVETKNRVPIEPYDYPQPNP